MKFLTPFTRTQKSIKDVQCVEYTHPSKVKKSLAYAVDINQIYKNFCQTHMLPLNGSEPIYDENFIKYDSLIEAQKLCDAASSYFNGLPAEIKNQYGNSLTKFIKGLNNKDDFLIKQGLLKIQTSETVEKTDIPENNIPSSGDSANNVNTALTD